MGLRKSLVSGWHSNLHCLGQDFMGYEFKFTFITSRDWQARYGTIEGLGPRQEEDQLEY